MLELAFPLTLSNARAALAEGLHAIDAGQTTFDLSRIEALDSAAVAILLAWQRAAQARQATLVLCNPPDALCSLAALYGVTALLPLAAQECAHH